MDISQAIKQLNNLDNAIYDLLDRGMTSMFNHALLMTVEKNVYNRYTPSAEYASQRRYNSNLGIADPESLEHHVDGSTLTITNNAVFQDLYYEGHRDNSPFGASLVDVVESGNREFRQPFARPFMEDARDLTIEGSHNLVKMILGQHGIKLD